MVQILCRIDLRSATYLYGIQTNSQALGLGYASGSGREPLAVTVGQCINFDFHFRTLGLDEPSQY